MNHKIQGLHAKQNMGGTSHPAPTDQRVTDIWLSLFKRQRPPATYHWSRHREHTRPDRHHNTWGSGGKPGLGVVVSKVNQQLCCWQPAHSLFAGGCQRVWASCSEAESRLEQVGEGRAEEGLDRNACFVKPALPKLGADPDKIAYCWKWSKCIYLVWKWP